jgi:hypothetical protein
MKLKPGSPPSPRTPQWFSDVFKDLRDRRLLLPALALVVALVAVPFVLANPAAPPPPPSAPLALPEDAAAVDAAVLAEQTGIRSYKKRLAELNESNPFKQKFALPTPGSVALQEDPDAATATTETTSTATDAWDSSGIESTSSSISESTSTGTSSFDDPTFDDTTIEDTTIDETTETTTTTEAEPPKPDVRFYADRVDITFGTLGHARGYDDMRHLEFLPDQKAAVLAFVGLAGSGDRAVFTLSSEVIETEGEGSCAPKKPAPCQFLTLREGEERRIKYALDGKTYRLKLRETRIVRIPDPRDG